ncbi:hypothetical protein L6452_42092 [Arctium lappa]|uniref:Uncharacterized protein n=1 Tax=Arctium lappa TaxID=4217 RepID=A0ACB8XJ25_ARCLA|nr:hypothetical protein L6452_42092 [Arctium lappa]
MPDHLRFSTHPQSYRFSRKRLHPLSFYSFRFLSTLSLASFEGPWHLGIFHISKGHGLVLFVSLFSHRCEARLEMAPTTVWRISSVVLDHALTAVPTTNPVKVEMFLGIPVTFWTERFKPDFGLGAYVGC